jgi:hypothetical protein
MDTDLQSAEERDEDNNDITLLSSEYIDNSKLNMSQVTSKNKDMTRKALHRPSVRSISESPNVVNHLFLF